MRLLHLLSTHGVGLSIVIHYADDMMVVTTWVAESTLISEMPAQHHDVDLYGSSL